MCCIAAAIIFQVNHLTVPGTEEETTQDTEKITVPQTEPIMETESPAETESPGKFDSMEYYSATAGIQTVSELAQAGYVFSSAGLCSGQLYSWHSRNIIFPSGLFQFTGQNLSM